MSEKRGFGESDEERIQVVRQPLAGPFDVSLDWASIGMLAQAAQVLYPRQSRFQRRG